MRLVLGVGMVMLVDTARSEYTILDDPRNKCGCLQLCM